MRQSENSSDLDRPFKNENGDTGTTMTAAATTTTIGRISSINNINNSRISGSLLGLGRRGRGGTQYRHRTTTTREADEETEKQTFKNSSRRRDNIASQRRPQSQLLCVLIMMTTSLLQLLLHKTCRSFDLVSNNGRRYQHFFVTSIQPRQHGRPVPRLGRRIVSSSSSSASSSLVLPRNLRRIRIPSSVTTRLFMSSSQSSLPPPEISDDDDDGFYGYDDDVFMQPPPSWEMRAEQDTPRRRQQQQQQEEEDLRMGGVYDGYSQQQKQSLPDSPIINPFPFPQPKFPPAGRGGNTGTTSVRSTIRMPSLLDEYDLDEPTTTPGWDPTPTDLNASPRSTSSSASPAVVTQTETETKYTGKATVTNTNVEAQLNFVESTSRVTTVVDDITNRIEITVSGDTSSIKEQVDTRNGTRNDYSRRFSTQRENTFDVISEQQIDESDPFAAILEQQIDESPKSTYSDAVVPQISGGADNSKRLTPQDTVDSLKVRLDQTENEIWTFTRNKKFNLNSPRQVSEALFGRPDMSTSKSVLDGMATQNILAKLILEHRQIKSQLTKLSRRLEAQQKQHQQQQRQLNQYARPAKTNNNDPINSVRNTNDGNSYYNDAYYKNVPVKVEDPVLLVDLSSLIFRAYYSMPPIHRPVDGMPVGAVMGFCNMLNRLVLNEILTGKQPRLILCCDADTSKTKTFRHDLYLDYKSHRPPLPLDLIPQFALITKAAKAYGIPQIQAEGFEADDVIATLATQACFEEGLPVRILSGDKDLMQLITNRTIDDFAVTSNQSTRSEAHALHNIHMIDPTTMTTWTHESVVEKWGVSAHQLGDVLALAGDAADNVPGVPGIGPKIAAQLVQAFGSLEELLDRTHEIPQKGRRSKLETYKDQALLSKDLVRLVRDLEMHKMQMISPDHDDGDFKWRRLDDYYGSDNDAIWEVGKLRMGRMNADRILQLYDEMGFVTIKERLIERLKRQPVTSYGNDRVQVKQVEDKVQSSSSSPGRPDLITERGRKKSDYGDPSPFSDDDFEDIDDDDVDDDDVDTGNDDEDPSIMLGTTDEIWTDNDQTEETAPKKKKGKKTRFTRKKWGIPAPDDYIDVPF